MNWVSQTNYVGFVKDYTDLFKPILLEGKEL